MISPYPAPGTLLECMALSENDHKDRYRENIVVRVLSPLSQATVIPRQFCRKTTKPALRKIAGFSHGGLRKPGGGLISVMVPVPQHVWVQRLGQPTEGSFILQALSSRQSQSKTVPKKVDVVSVKPPVSRLTDTLPHGCDRSGQNIGKKSIALKSFQPGTDSPKPSKHGPPKKKSPDRIDAAIPVSGLSGTGTRPAPCQGAADRRALRKPSLQLTAAVERAPPIGVYF